MWRSLVILALAVAPAIAAPRWRFTEAAEWIDATLPDSGADSIGTLVATSDEAKAAIKDRGPLSLWVTPANVCAVMPGLAGAGARIALHIDGALTDAASTCILTIAPAALALPTGVHLPVPPSLRALALITATDGDLAALSKLPQLESLAIGHGFSDLGLASLASMKRLVALELISAKVTAAGLAKLGGLHTLSLDSMTVTREQLEGVGALTRLRTLDLGHAGVDGGDLAVLAKLTKLSSLRVRRDALPAALGPIGKLAGLRSLRVHGSLDDDAAAALKTWSKKHPRVRVGK